MAAHVVPKPVRVVLLSINGTVADVQVTHAMGNNRLSYIPNAFASALLTICNSPFALKKNTSFEINQSFFEIWTTKQHS